MTISEQRETIGVKAMLDYVRNGRYKGDLIETNMAAEKHVQKGTQCVWSGEEGCLMQGATQVPVVHSVSFGYEDGEECLVLNNSTRRRTQLSELVRNDK